MRILVLSTWDDQGSGFASYNLGKFLKEAGHDVILAVRDKSQPESFVLQVPRPSLSIVQRILNKLLLKDANFKTIREYYFLNTDESKEIVSAENIIQVLTFKPDLIITGLVSGFVTTKTLVKLQEKTGAKIYSLAVDMALMTGGCHYAWDCTGYRNNCADCPAILNRNLKDRARDNLEIKIKNVRKANVKAISMSEWTRRQLKESVLFKNQEEIFNVNSMVDTNLFNSKHRGYAKNLFDLPLDSRIIFTGSRFTDDIRKGIQYFIESLVRLWEMNPDLRETTYVLIAGETDNQKRLASKIPFGIKFIDFLKDRRLLSLAYQASDVFVCSSIEDAGPMMVSEALACGTPVVSFDMGVATTMVINGYNGYKAQLRNSEELAKGVSKILSLSRTEFDAYSRNSVDQVKNYSSEKILLETVDKILSS